jgi:hypothetical protein
MGMNQNIERIGNFTSSQISRLVEGTRGLTDKQEAEMNRLIDRKAQSEEGEAKVLTTVMEQRLEELKHIKENPLPTKSQLTYIEEKQIELRLGRSIKLDKHTGRPAAWGNFMEHFVFSLIGTEYIITSNDTDLHPTISGWSGSKDLIVTGIKVSDIKCYEPKKFALYTDVLMAGDIQRLKDEFAQEYWQLVSNAVINEVPNAEAITFMPYLSQLNEIRELASDYEGADQWKYRFIYESEDAELPYIPEGGHYKNLNKFEFEVPQEDRDFLTQIVLESIELRDQK